MTKQIQGTIDDAVRFSERVNIDFNNPNDLRKLYSSNGSHVSMTLTENGNRVPGMMDLANLITRINKTEKSFSVIKHMEVSPTYNKLIKVTDTVRRPFVKEMPKRELFPFFLDQQKNVLELNHVLAKMVLNYKGSLNKLTETTSLRLNSHDQFIEQKLETEELLPALLTQYNEVKTELEEFDKSKKPLEYNKKLREFREIRDEYLDARSSWERASFKNKNLSHRIEYLTLSEEVFNKQLYNTMHLSEKVHSYQEALDDTVSHWIASKDLAEGAGYLMQGVSVLENYNREMNSVFENSIRDLVVILDKQKTEDVTYSFQTLKNANDKLESFSEERTDYTAKM